MSETPRLLLLIPTTGYRTGDFLDAAQRLGVQVAVGSDHPPHGSKDLADALAGVAWCTA